MPRFLLSLFFLFTIHYSLFTGVASACDDPNPGPWYNQTPCQFATRVKTAPPSEIFGERYTFAQINWIINSLIAMADPNIGGDLTQMQNFIDTMQRNLDLNQLPDPSELAKFGPVGFIGSLIVSTSYPPASGIQSINDTLAKFDLAAPAQAQGYGYTYTNAILPLWRAARNFSYLVMILLLVIAGFMIMFRIKINAQAAVTLQLMIPKIVFTLLGITFSYAIAGLVIDLVYVLLALTLAIAGPAGAFTDNPVTVITWFSTPAFSRIVFYYFFVLVASMETIWVNLTTITSLGDIVNSVVAVLLLAAVVCVIVMLLKIWIMLLKTYVHLLFLIIAGPIYILFGLLPGSSMGIGKWLRQITAHASVFLVVPLMFFLNMVIWSGILVDRVTWWPRILGAPGGITGGPILSGNYPGFPLFGQQGWLTSLAIGFTIIAIIPKTAEAIKESLKAKGFDFQTAIGEAYGAPGKLYDSYQGYRKERAEKAEKTAAQRYEYDKMAQHYQSSGGSGAPPKEITKAPSYKKFSKSK